VRQGRVRKRSGTVRTQADGTTHSDRRGGRSAGRGRFGMLLDRTERGQATLSTGPAKFRDPKPNLPRDPLLPTYTEVDPVRWTS